MKKGKFRYHLQNDDKKEETTGICLYHEEKNILIYKEKNGTEVFLDIDHLMLTRENDEMLLVLNFSDKASYINMKKMDRKMALELETKDKEVKANSIMVRYVLSGQNEFVFHIEWELDGE